MNKKEELKKEVKMWMANDYELVEDTPEYYLLKKSTASLGVHILILLIFWWTLGLANLIYHLLAKKKKKIFKN